MQPQYRVYALLGVRMIELLSIASLILGSMWATTDYLTFAVLTTTVVGPLSPLSIFMMLYGFLGLVASELLARHWGGNAPTKK